MTQENKAVAFRVLVLITTPQLAPKAITLFERGKIPVQYQCYGQGTASSEILDLLGLGSSEKTVFISMMPKLFAEEMLKKIRKELKIGSLNSGIAFTLSMSGGSSLLLKMIEGLQEQTIPERKRINMSEYDYTMIVAVVNQGFNEEVMKAARPAGASGGTVLHSRRIGNEEVQKFWGISVQQEKELVIILAKEEDKLAIMQAIGEKCGMHSEARGIVLSVPVENIIGLE